MLLELDSGFFSHFTIQESTGRQTFHEDISGKSNLIVTIGDSWTWGDSIDGINPFTKLDSPKRLENVYGAHIKNSLKTYDWINIAIPGTGNRWITDTAKRFVNIATQSNYQHIIIICLFSDTCRDAEYGIEQLGIKFTSVNDLVSLIDKHFLTDLSIFDSISNIDLVVARNFTDTHPDNIKIVKHHLPANWVDFSRINWNPDFQPLPFFTGYVGNHKNLISNLTLEQKIWIDTEYYDAADKITQFLNDCPLHYKVASKHPTEENHKLWAMYLIKYLRDKQIVKE